MLNFSADPVLADKQMRAVIFYLVTFGHIDGEFDLSEKAFVRDVIRRLVEERVRIGAALLPEARQAELVDTYTAHFHLVMDATDTEVEELFSESVARDEDSQTFVHGRLKLRCFEIFQSFDKAGQEGLLEVVDSLLMADGEVHPAELKFRGEMSDLLNADLRVELLDEEVPGSRAQLLPEIQRPSGAAVHPFFDQFEHDYSDDPERAHQQIQADRQAMARAMSVLADHRAKGAGKLAGRKDLGGLPPGGMFLDGHVWACAPVPGRRYDLTVLGDLHGCYSCLKAAIMQARFFEKFRLFREAPDRHPEPKLVLLGDYIDRGIYSLNGVLRAALLLFCTAPEHVVILRGNHEYFIEFEGGIYGGVKPSEAIDGLKQRASDEVAREYMRLFDALPAMFIFDRALFVHGGIPRDRSFRDHFRDLSSLNHPDLRFEMMWGDPSPVDVVPAALQEENARFAFGRMQAERFLRRVGCHTLVRGHEKMREGIRADRHEGGTTLVTLFSAGGAENNDLPQHSGYRNVRPMALTASFADGECTLAPWEIDYKPYNDPRRNAFFRDAAAR